MTTETNDSAAPRRKGTSWTMWSICGIDEARFREYLDTMSTYRDIARALGVHKDTVAKYAKKLGYTSVHHQRARPKTLTFGRERGAVAAWVRAHPGSKLPVKSSEIARLVGCSVPCVSMYFTRRAQRAAAWAASLGDLAALDTTLTLDHGLRLPTKRIWTTTWRANGRTLSLVATLEIGTGKFLAWRTTPQELASLWNGVDTLKRI